MGKRNRKAAKPSPGAAGRAGKAPGGRPGGAGDGPALHRKLVGFDAETWQAVDLLGRDTFMTFQELADEAFRDLLRKHGRPVELRDQLKRSARASEASAKSRRG